MPTHNPLDQKLNLLIENVFLITINKSSQRKKQMIFLEEIAESGQQLMNLETLEMASFLVVL